MIDYDKIKLAHELAESYHKKTNYSVYIVTSSAFGCFGNGQFKLCLNQTNYDYENIDDLIAKLQELTQPEEPKAKREIGQRWWYLDEANFMMYPEPKSMLITAENVNRYWVDEEWFPTKSALLEAQLNYWQKLYDEEENDRRSICVVSCIKCNQLVFGGSDCSCSKTDEASTYNDSSHVQEKFCTPVKECQHEAHEDFYVPDSHGIHHFRCKKCGEFYR